MLRSRDLKFDAFAARVNSLLLDSIQRLKTVWTERAERGKDRHLVLVESLSLGNRRQLFLVACDDHRFLVGASADRVGTLVATSEATPDAAVHSPAAHLQPARRQGGRQQPTWMSGLANEAGRVKRLQLVKRADESVADPNHQASTEAGRTPW